MCFPQHSHNDIGTLDADTINDWRLHLLCQYQHVTRDNSGGHCQPAHYTDTEEGEWGIVMMVVRNI